MSEAAGEGIGSNNSLVRVVLDQAGGIQQFFELIAW